MKQIYETFEEVVSDFIEHRSKSKTSNDGQSKATRRPGAREFARFLDNIEVKLVEDSRIHGRLYEYFQPPTRVRITRFKTRKSKV